MQNLACKMCLDRSIHSETEEFHSSADIISLADVHAIANDVVTLGVTAVQMTKSNWPGVSSVFVVDTKQNINYLNCYESNLICYVSMFLLGQTKNT